MSNTYYIPNEYGWPSTSGQAYIRLKVVQTYDITVNKSTLVVSLQAKGVSVDNQGLYSWGTNSYSYIKVNGTKIYESTVDAVGYNLAPKVNLDNSGTWKDIASNSSSVPSSWNYIVSHNDNGAASVVFGFYGDINYLGSSYYYQHFSGSADSELTSTLNLSENRSFTLSISAGTGSSITVKKGQTTLSDGATVKYGDSLTISFAALTGYQLDSHTVNGQAFTSGNNYTVIGAVNVAAIASVLQYALSIFEGPQTSIVVNRTSSPLEGAATGALTDGATIYYNDVLEITFAASLGFSLSTHTVNESTFESGDDITVTSDIYVAATSNVDCFVEIGNDVNFDQYTIHIGNGTSFDTYQAYIGNGTSWEPYY